MLEYFFRHFQRIPEISGQFWYDDSLITDGVVLEQTLEVRVPKDKEVQISSPKLKPDIYDEGDVRVYRWKHSQLHPSKLDAKQTTSSEDEGIKVQLSTFKPGQQ